MKSGLNVTTNYKKELIDFWLTDKYGRKIGVEISTYEATFTELPEDVCAYYSIEAGHYFALRFWATRDGKTYGALQPNNFFKTEKERQQ